jgi:GT2 family glycosyltransferase
VGAEFTTLAAEAARLNPDEFRGRAESLLRGRESYPAFRNYLVACAGRVYGNRIPPLEAPRGDGRPRFAGARAAGKNAAFHSAADAADQGAAAYARLQNGLIRLSDVLSARMEAFGRVTQSWFERSGGRRRETHPLFDPLYYLAHNPEAAVSGLPPFQHYLERGGLNGLNPHPVFDSAYYLAANPEVAAAGVNPLMHFLETGAARGRSPHPLFDTAYYLRKNPDVSAAGINPLVHYLLYGAAEGREPHPLFRGAYYLEQHPEVAACGANPLVHFLEFGAAQGCRPHPLFDPAYYTGQCDTPPANPLRHFVIHGVRQRLSPHPLFDSAYYLREHPEIASSAATPLEHYLETGARAGWNPHPLFDTAYYLQQNSEVAAAGANPLEHFVRWGGQAGRDPGRHFDARYYLDQNVEVAASGVNPLVHFIVTGARAGRKPNPRFDVEAYLVQHPDIARSDLNPLEHFLAVEAAGPHGAVRPARRSGRFLPMSVVIPTNNRAELLAGTLEACVRLRGGCDLELIVVDDGSTDDTGERVAQLAGQIPGLVWQRAPKAGPATARNIGAAAARHEVILFLGDDIRPLNADFFRTHASAHEAAPQNDIAVLGKVIWPAGLDVTFTMSHAQGRGGQQFDFESLRSNAFTDWQHFYTANVSVKKALVSDWTSGGFDRAFPDAAFEDLEFAYRLSKQASLRIFYDPEALAGHHHRYTLTDFVARQFRAGRALPHLFGLHPELTGSWGSETVLQAAVSSRGSARGKAREPEDLIARLIAYAAALEERSQLGSQPWHGDFVSALLELCMLHGLAATRRKQNDLAAGLDAALARFRSRLAQTKAPAMEQLAAPARAAPES